MEYLTLLNQLPAPTTSRSTTLPIDKPAKMYSDPYKFDLDKGFSQDDIKVLMKYKLPPPSQILESIKNGELDFESYKKVLVK